MLYILLKLPAQLALRIYCRYLRINKKELLAVEGPLLLACNHPNSFLDAIIICTIFKRPVYSLARGDAFKKKWIANVLHSLNILPVYRIKEGSENLRRNYDTFDNCIDIFKQNGVVLIFSEAYCENEWHLRKLKKGTARLALSAWEQNIPLKILPVGINYSSFNLFGKNIHINFGDAITKKDCQSELSDNGKLLNELTLKIENQLHALVYEINEGDKLLLHNTFYQPLNSLKKALLFVPALIGRVIYFPVSLLIKKSIGSTTAELGHYDAIYIGLAVTIYPVYLLVISLLVYWFIGGWWFLLTFILLPFFAWSYVQLKRQL